MTRQRQRGFSLVEVLVALIVTSIGLLGIAKLQAVSYASTGTSSIRSLAAIEASSMVAAIRANRTYWSTAPTPLTVSVSAGASGGPPTVTSSDSALAGSFVCQSGVSPTNAPCTPSELAAVDVHNWATSLQGGLVGATTTIQGLPDFTASITCPTPATGPVTCAVMVKWQEHTVGVDSQSRNAVSTVYGGGVTNFTLLVVP